MFHISNNLLNELLILLAGMMVTDCGNILYPLQVWSAILKETCKTKISF
jgi:hypothetical protein